MKKIYLTGLLTLAALFAGAQTSAEMTLMSSNGSFTFDPSGAMGGSSFVVDGDNGLSDIAFFLGYQETGIGAGLETIALNSGVFSADPDFPAAGNRGRFTFDPVTFANGVIVNAVADFRLDNTTGLAGPEQGNLLYELALTTTGVNNTNEGALSSFVGFDFNGNGSDQLQADQTIPGLGDSDAAIGNSNRILAGDFTFTQPEGGSTVSTANDVPVDVFQGPIGGNLAARFNGTSEPFGNGDLAFGAFSDFLGRNTDRTDVTAGVINFRSTAAIPEPTSLTLAAVGFGMVAFRRRRRNR